MRIQFLSISFALNPVSFLMVHIDTFNKFAAELFAVANKVPFRLSSDRISI